jgi:hypothetical protein
MVTGPMVVGSILVLLFRRVLVRAQPRVVAGHAALVFLPKRPVIAGEFLREVLGKIQAISQRIKLFLGFPL